MRKVNFYLLIFKESLFVILVGILFLFLIKGFPNQFDSNEINYLIQIIATFVGVALSIFIAKGFEKIQQRKRIKKTFAILKLVTIKYLDSQVFSMKQTLDRFNDICSVEKAEAFIRLASSFSEIATTFDTTWFSLILTQDFLDTVEDDTQINSIAHSILEVNLYIKQLGFQSANAEQLKIVPPIYRLESDYPSFVIMTARKIRKEMYEQAQKLEKYTILLDREIMYLLNKTGVKYEEFER